METGSRFEVLQRLNSLLRTSEHKPWDVLLGGRSASALWEEFGFGHAGSENLGLKEGV